MNFNCYRLVLVSIVIAGIFVKVGLAISLPSAPVRVAKVKLQAMAPVRWVAGSVIGRNDARISAEVEGRLVEVLEVGDRVKAGGRISTIDPVVFQLQLAEADATITRIQARRNYLNREVNRLRRLAEQNLAAGNSYDEIQADRNVANAELKAAYASQARAKDKLKKTLIRAPFAGVITIREKSPGEHVEIGDVVARIVDPQHLEIQAHVPQRSIPYLVPGARLKVRDTKQVLTAKGFVPWYPWVTIFPGSTNSG